MSLETKCKMIVNKGLPQLSLPSLAALTWPTRSSPIGFSADRQLVDLRTGAAARWPTGWAQKTQSNKSAVCSLLGPNCTLSERVGMEPHTFYFWGAEEKSMQVSLCKRRWYKKAGPGLFSQIHVLQTGASKLKPRLDGRSFHKGSRHGKLIVAFAMGVP